MGDSYTVAFEVAGPSAMFTRPDTGAAPVSYPVPTSAAARGMFESIARLKSAHIRPTKVEVCAPILFEPYTTNYGGPLRKSNQIQKGASYQLYALRLVNVCYRVYGEVVPTTPQPTQVNHLHALADIFTRRLTRGQCHYTPFLGWKEFVPTYFGPLRPTTQIEDGVSVTIPSLLCETFAQPGVAQWAPQYCQNARIEKGVLRYAQ